MFTIEAEVITYYLATHCMLAHNEARQNMMIRRYEEAIKFLPEEEAAEKLERFTTDQSLPDDYCKILSNIYKTSSFMYEMFHEIVAKLSWQILYLCKFDTLNREYTS